MAEVVRSGFIEGHHYGACVQLDRRGEVVWSLGGPDTVIFPRSCNKPIQTLGMLRAGLPLEGWLLALASASHSGESFHLDGVRKILAQAGLDESALQTVPAYPLDPAVRNEYVRAGGWPTRICMDCSGKHAAMLLTCVHNGWPIEDYLSPAHPLQRIIADTFAELTGAQPMAVGVDGCGAPLLATSLTRLARAIGVLVRSAAGSLEHRLVAAMVAAPEYLSGSTRDEAFLMHAFPGSVAKSGAEGVYVVAMPDGNTFAIKIDDGAERARAVVMARILLRAGYRHRVLEIEPTIRGGGKPVGSIRAAF